MQDDIAVLAFRLLPSSSRIDLKVEAPQLESVVTTEPHSPQG
jgi:hypothetical protein